jgi:hypothetical protein
MFSQDARSAGQIELASAAWSAGYTLLDVVQAAMDANWSKEDQANVRLTWIENSARMAAVDRNLIKKQGEEQDHSAARLVRGKGYR